MVLHQKSSARRQVHAGRNLARRRGLIWLIWVGLGVVGLWQMVFPGPQPVPGVLHVMALEADRPEFLELTEGWLVRAQAIYPFDPSVHICLGRLMLWRGNREAAETWLRQAADETAGTNQACLVRAWQAVAAATAGRPKAPALLRSCLKQELPYTLRQRVEAMLGMACATTGKPIFRNPGDSA